MTQNIYIQTVAHAAQRYDTVGDWYEEDGQLVICVSSLRDPRHEMLIAVHELVEALLCRQRGILEEEVTEFDTSFAGDGEPGDDPRAPYHREHMFAFSIERQLASEAGVDWDEYERALTELRR